MVFQVYIYICISNSAIRMLCRKIQLALGPLTLTLFPRTRMCAHLWDVQNISLSSACQRPLPSVVSKGCRLLIFSSANCKSTPAQAIHSVSLSTAANSHAKQATFAIPQKNHRQNPWKKITQKSLYRCCRLYRLHLVKFNIDTTNSHI